MVHRVLIRHLFFIELSFSWWFLNGKSLGLEVFYVTFGKSQNCLHSTSNLPFSMNYVKELEPLQEDEKPKQTKFTIKKAVQMLDVSPKKLRSLMGDDDEEGVSWVMRALEL